ncbi:MAG: glycosyltransferase family 4 protein, partial [Candidatus Moranbacteria bacterium]|nr:glycosyltransferase family 4 protein [Candidatus Moranbacteria bacterium]
SSDLLNASDLAVSPNIPVPGTMEGFGINVIEANACGLPVIAADLEGLTEAVQNGENGTLIPPLDSDGFVAEIRRLMEDPGQLAERRKKASSYAAATFHWNVLSDKYLEAFEEMLTSAS